jgi:hypothetical protein
MIDEPPVSEPLAVVVAALLPESGRATPSAALAVAVAELLPDSAQATRAAPDAPLVAVDEADIATGPPAV